MTTSERLKQYISDHYVDPNRNGYIAYSQEVNEEMREVLDKLKLPTCVFNGVPYDSHVRSFDVDEYGNIQIFLSKGEFVRPSRALDYQTLYNYITVNHDDNNNYQISRIAYKHSENRDGIIALGAYNTIVDSIDNDGINEIKILKHQQVAGELGSKDRSFDPNNMSLNYDDTYTLLSKNREKFNPEEILYRDVDGTVYYNNHKLGHPSNGVILPSAEVYTRTLISLHSLAQFDEAINFSMAGLTHQDMESEI